MINSRSKNNHFSKKYPSKFSLNPLIALRRISFRSDFSFCTSHNEPYSVHSHEFHMRTPPPLFGLLSINYRLRIGSFSCRPPRRIRMAKKQRGVREPDDPLAMSEFTWCLHLWNSYDGFHTE
ncbi:hypothetical protein CEXT_8521 [Caerostris extrusa]|uniref:Uncharacterized protein n=1 Tax=Caerostris extrusa TaxID=172846 RepID=A0AAV4PSU0_CAEEX|nr:hypothetical protein CEXT_8521 [Caerostris extrusa]